MAGIGNAIQKIRGAGTMVVRQINDQAFVADHSFETFPAKLVAQQSIDGHECWSWLEMGYDEFGQFFAVEGGRFGSSDGNPAFEIGGTVADVDSIVWMWPGYFSVDHGQEYVFGMTCTGSGSGSGSGGPPPPPGECPGGTPWECGSCEGDCWVGDTMTLTFVSEESTSGCGFTQSGFPITLNRFSGGGQCLDYWYGEQIGTLSLSYRISQEFDPDIPPTGGYVWVMIIQIGVGEPGYPDGCTTYYPLELVSCNPFQLRFVPGSDCIPDTICSCVCDLPEIIITE